MVSTLIGTEKNTIIFVKTVNHHNVDWSLGAALSLLHFSVFFEYAMMEGKYLDSIKYGVG